MLFETLNFEITSIFLPTIRTIRRHFVVFVDYLYYSHYSLHYSSFINYRERTSMLNMWILSHLKFCHSVLELFWVSKDFSMTFFAFFFFLNVPQNNQKIQKKSVDQSPYSIICKYLKNVLVEGHCFFMILPY